MGKASQLALVKIRKSMTKASKRIKGSFLKAEKEDKGKSRKVFQRGGHSFLLWNSKSCKKKEGNFLKERKSFLMTQEKQKDVITQKRKLLTKGG